QTSPRSRSWWRGSVGGYGSSPASSWRSSLGGGGAPDRSSKRWTREPLMTDSESAVAAADKLRREFHLERFVDHLRFERGVSDRTLEAYDHDVSRLAVFLASQGRRDPGVATASDLRAFVLCLKDLGLAAS